VSTLGSDCLTKKRNKLVPFSHAAIYDTRYSLPSRINGMLNLKEKLTTAIEEVGAHYSTALWDDILEEHKLTKTIFPLARTFLYCAPCVCLVQTAILVCDRASSTMHEYLIRPDDRLKSSCCLEQDRTAGLRSIYNAVKDNEAKAQAPLDRDIPVGTRYVDMLWLEERLLRMEYEDEHVEFQSQPLGDAISRVVVIGEPAYLRPITQKMTCSRVPREAEIWQLQIPSNDGPCKQRFFGTFTLSRPILPTQPLPISVNSLDVEFPTTATSPNAEGLLRGPQTSGVSSTRPQNGSQARFNFVPNDDMEDTEVEGWNSSSQLQSH
jgi:hypothetical protein